MNAPLYMRTCATFFLIIFVLHLLRVIYGWEVVIAGWSPPMWPSWAAVLVSGFLSAYGFRLASQRL